MSNRPDERVAFHGRKPGAAPSALLVVDPDVNPDRKTFEDESSP